MLGWAARLAVGLPALMAGAQVAAATAHADDDDNNDDDRRDRGRGRGRDFVRSGTFAADLVPVNQVNGSDFNPGNSDAGSGTLVVGSAGTSASTVSVRLRGATANQTYTVAFVPLSSTGARLGLGSFTTNGAGNGQVTLRDALGQSGSAANNLGTRVGVFVLRRGDINGPDAFVTAA
jgi:hypothetical protein